MPFVIQHKQTKELFKAKSGKTSWQKAGHAKNAFANTVKHHSLAEYDCLKYGDLYTNTRHGKYSWHGLYFDEQDVWEIVELKTTTNELFGESLTLLKEVFEREHSVSWGLADRIEKHLIACGVEINYED